jgi:hypothetical protein
MHSDADRDGQVPDDEYLAPGFRDHDQWSRVLWVLHDRLMDDRNQAECRYLLRLPSQLGVNYHHSVEELRENVGVGKLSIIVALITAIRESPDAIDRWVETTVDTMPVIHDRGFKATRRRFRRLRLKATAARIRRFLW